MLKLTKTAKFTSNNIFPQFKAFFTMLKSITIFFLVTLSIFAAAQTQPTSAPVNERIYKGAIILIHSDSIATFKFCGNEYLSYFILPKLYRSIKPKPTLDNPFFATIIVQGIRIITIKRYDYAETRL